MKILKATLRILLIIIVVIAGFAPSQVGYANEPKNMAFEIGHIKVDRVKTLEKFFKEFNSPLAENAETFVRVADEYKIDYTLLPAIACQESTCAKFLIDGTYNPFGWGIYGNNYISFESYDHAIEEVGRGLYEGYFSKGLDTLYEIAPVYTPPSNGSWFRGVSWFESQIESLVVEG